MEVVLFLLIASILQPNVSAVKVQEARQSGPNKLTLNISTPAETNGSLKSENNTQMSALVSKVRHFENLQNETILIDGKLIETSDGSSLDSVTVRPGVTEGWRPMIVNYDEVYSSTESFNDESLNGHETASHEITKSTLEQFQEKSLNSGVKANESYKVSSNFKNRPHFHVIDITEFQNKVDENIPVKKILKKQARFNIENEELEFPNFETQFFGSFGELSSPDQLKVPHPRPDLNKFHDESGHFIGNKYGSHNLNTDHHNHHHSQQDHPYSHHVPPVSTEQKYHPKRETLSSHKPHQIKDNYIGGPPKDVSALYVDDPWKHIDKVVDSIPPYQPQSQGYEPESFVVDHDITHHQDTSYQEPYKPDPVYEEPYQPNYDEPYQPKPVYEQPYQPKPVYEEPYHIEPTYEEPKPVYEPHPVYEEPYQPEPIYEEPYHDSYEPPHLPPTYYEYSSPNFRPPIESKPIHNQKHEIVSVAKPHHHQPPPKHHYHSNRNNKAISFLDQYIHPVQHVQLSQQIPSKLSLGHHNYEVLQTGVYNNPHGNNVPGSVIVEDPFIYQDNPVSPYHQTIHEEKHKYTKPSRSKGGRFLKLHANEYSDVTEFGAETWGYGAFNWFSNHPVITYN